jgi:lipoprotein signal peptidase
MTQTNHRCVAWQLGLLLILAGPLANSVLTTFDPLVPPLTNAQRGQAFGRGLASVVFVVAGVVLVVRHFFQRKRAQRD